MSKVMSAMRTIVTIVIMAIVVIAIAKSPIIAIAIAIISPAIVINVLPRLILDLLRNISNFLWLIIKLLWRVCVCSIAIVYQVDITEVPVAVVATMGVFVIGRVLGSWCTGLNIAVSIGAEDKGLGITIVDTIIATFAWVYAMVRIACPVVVVIITRGSSTGHQSQCNQHLHVGWLILVNIRLCSIYMILHDGVTQGSWGQQFIGYGFIVN